jgi:hypothetical protein
MCVLDEIRLDVDLMIAEDELVSRANFRAVRQFDEVRGPMMLEGEKWTEEEQEIELQAYREFVSWYLSLDYLPITSLPNNTSDKWFPPKELDEFGNDTSAFNTMDFQRKIGFKFNVEFWKLQKTFDRLQDLAQTHSCLTTQSGRRNIEQRFKSIIDREFVSKLIQTGQAKYLIQIQDAHNIWKKTAFQT